MAQGKERNLKNDLKSDPEFDLDDYIEENSRDEASLYEDPKEEQEPEGSRAKNFILIAVTIAFAIWWFDNDWNPFNNFSGLFGGEDNTTQVAEAPDTDLNIDIPSITIPPLNGESAGNGSDVAALDIPLSEYLAELRQAGLLEEKISAFSARQVYDGGVPISYLQELDETGFLEDLSFVYINSYYQNQVPTDYLNELREAGIYEGLSFVEVTNFYSNGVTTEYLIQLDEAGYLDELSFVYINAYYDAGVTPAFLDRLKEQGIYNDLSFLDVVDIYEREGN